FYNNCKKFTNGVDELFMRTKPKPAFINQEKVQKEVKAVLTESATLTCEVAQDTTEVKWYKDGKLLVSSRKFKIETLGKTRRLVVGQLEKKDAGEYICEAAGQKMTFKLEVKGEQCPGDVEQEWCGDQGQQAFPDP
uniref:Ig-like domain-containing protein n=1 Tax=Zonotrichia albicollis TaxID=44394 RepID=A0A8D2N880_ZONAL